MILRETRATSFNPEPVCPPQGWIAKLSFEGTLLGTPNREPQEYSRNIVELYLPGSLYSLYRSKTQRLETDTCSVKCLAAKTGATFYTDLNNYLQLVFEVYLRHPVQCLSPILLRLARE